jgi:hypothetical protein
MSIDGARDSPVGTASFVLIDHRRTLTVVAHPSHQVLDLDPGRSCEREHRQVLAKRRDDQSGDTDIPPSGAISAGQA